MPRFIKHGPDWFAQPDGRNGDYGARYEPLPNTPARPMLPVIAILLILIAGVMYV